MAQGPLKKGKPGAKRYVLCLFLSVYLCDMRDRIPANIFLSYSPAALGPRRGPQTIAPKKAALIKQTKMTKVRPATSTTTPSFPIQKYWLLIDGSVQKLTAGMTAKTERALASKAGHLELLAGGKKDKKAADKAGKK